jgi:hypothetical protein
MTSPLSSLGKHGRDDQGDTPSASDDYYVPECKRQAMVVKAKIKVKMARRMLDEAYASRFFHRFLFSGFSWLKAVL